MISFWIAALLVCLTAVIMVVFVWVAIKEMCRLSSESEREAVKELIEREVNGTT